MTAIDFAPLGGGSAQYQNRVTVKGSYSEDGSGLVWFAANPTSFEANYQANNPKYILIQPGIAPSLDMPSSDGSYSGTSSTTTTTKNPDGSVTDRTENRATGTVTTAAMFPDGSQAVVEAKKGGSSVAKGDAEERRDRHRQRRCQGKGGGGGQAGSGCGQLRPGERSRGPRPHSSASCRKGSADRPVCQRRMACLCPCPMARR